MLEKLIALNIQVNSISHNGFTALHLSFLNTKDFVEKTKICDALINADADISKQTLQKESLLSLAISRNDIEGVVYLLKKEDEIGLKNYLHSKNGSMPQQNNFTLQQALEASRIARFRPQMSLLSNNNDDVIFQCVRLGRATILQHLLPYLIDEDYQYYHQHLEKFEELFSNSFTHNIQIEWNSKKQIISDLKQLFKNRLRQIGAKKNTTKKHLNDLLASLEKANAKIPSPRLSKTKKQKRDLINTEAPTAIHAIPTIHFFHETPMEVQYENAENTLEKIHRINNLPEINGNMLFSDLLSLVGNNASSDFEFIFKFDDLFYPPKSNGFYRLIEIKTNNGDNTVFISSSDRSLTFANLLLECAKKAGNNYFNVDYIYDEISHSYTEADCLAYLYQLETKTSIFLDEETLPLSMILKFVHGSKDKGDLTLFFSKSYENETIYSFTQASTSIEDKLLYINNKIILVESNFDNLKPLYHDILELCVEQLETLLSLQLSIQQELSAKKNLQNTLKLFILLHLKNVSENTNYALGKLCYTPHLDPGLKLATLLDINMQLHSQIDISTHTYMSSLQLINVQNHIDHVKGMLSHFLFETRAKLLNLWFNPYLPFTVHVNDLVLYSFILENLSNISASFHHHEHLMLLDMKNFLLTKKLMLISNMKAQARLSLPECYISIGNIATFMQNLANLVNDIKYMGENIGEAKATSEIVQLLHDIQEKENLYRTYFQPLIEHAETCLADPGLVNINSETYPHIYNTMTMISLTSNIESERQRASNIISKISQLALYHADTPQITTSIAAPAPARQENQSTQHIPHLSFFADPSLSVPCSDSITIQVNCDARNENSR